MRSLARPLALVLLSVALSACGEARVDPDRDTSSSPGAWDTQRLSGEVGADQAPLLATADADALVLTVSEEGTVFPSLSVGGSPFEAGEPLATGLGWLQLGGLARLDDGSWLALGAGGSSRRDGDTELSFDPVALRSSDGRSWERVETTGLAGPIEISDLAVVDGTVVASGSYRLADEPSNGGFEAHVWTSADGVSFTQIDLPGVPASTGYRTESYAGPLALVDGRVVVAGRVGSSAAVWTSDDAGTSWRRSSGLPDVYTLSGLAVVGDVVLAGTGDDTIAALRSVDGGDTWVPVDGLPSRPEESGWAPVWAGGGGFWTLTGVDDMSWSTPEVCYADLDQCERRPDPQVLTSADGVTWTAVALPGEFDQLVGTADGRTLVVGVGLLGPYVQSLPAGATPPPAAAPSEPERITLVTPEQGEPPEVGVRYHAPMFVHCGMTWLWFADRTWRRTDGGPDVEGGAGDRPPEGWPLVGQTLYGFATLTDADHLDYSTEVGVIATYERAAGAPGCD